MFPLASVETRRSPRSFDSRSVPPVTPRTGLPSSGTTYTPAPPSAARSFTAPSSSRSRERVAWVVSMPSAASRAASSDWLRTAWAESSSTMRDCRPARVRAMAGPLPCSAPPRSGVETLIVAPPHPVVGRAYRPRRQGRTS
ncbi:Uncharacterised protein [Mycobacteroides abscessus subsp. abscessus]|nr:Uncharacterised protein [Mycobacteroides abscessus subsp. abscessus]